MDRTAVASIVIGLGATVAAMVFPTKYPKTPKWAIEVTCYGGLFLVIASVAYLISEHPFRDLGGAAIAAFEWFSTYLIAVQRLPGFWLVIVFAAGMAANHWGTPLILTWWRRGNVDRSPLVTTWLTPLQAAERFVDPELLSRDRAAQENAKNLAEKVKLLETELAGTVGSEKLSALQEQITSATRERDDADYVARRRRTDLVEYMREALSSRILVAKGCKVVRKKQARLLKKKNPSGLANYHPGC